MKKKTKLVFFTTLRTRDRFNTVSTFTFTSDKFISLEMALRHVIDEIGTIQFLVLHVEMVFYSVEKKYV